MATADAAVAEKLKRAGLTALLFDDADGSVAGGFEPAADTAVVLMDDVSATQAAALTDAVRLYREGGGSDCSLYLTARADPQLRKVLNRRAHKNGAAAAALAAAARPFGAVEYRWRAETDEESRADMENNRYFSVLGRGAEHSVVIRSKRSHEIFVMKPDQITAKRLIAIADLSWWTEKYGGEARHLTSTAIQYVINDLVAAAIKAGQYAYHKERGRGAHLDGDRVVYHLGDRLLVGGKTYPLDQPSEAGNIYVERPALPLATAEATADEVKAFIRAVAKYRWSSREDAVLFCGWLAAGLAGGLLEWRPHVWIVADAGGGKTWMISDVVKPLLGEHCSVVTDVSGAGLSRAINHDSLPVIIDEATPEKDGLIHQAIRVIRLASSAVGERVRAAQSDRGVVKMKLRASFLLSSNLMPPLKQADASRIWLLRFGAGVENWIEVRDEIKSSLADHRARRIRTYIINRLGELRAAAQTLADGLVGDGLDGRSAVHVATMLAGWRILSGEKDDDLRALARRMVKQRGVVAGRDVINALEILMSLPLVVAGREGYVGEALAAKTPAGLHAAEAMGFRFVSGGLAVACRHPRLTAALRGTRLEEVDVREALLNNPACRRLGQTRFRRMRTREAVLIPDALIGEVLTQ